MHSYLKAIAEKNIWGSDNTVTENLRLPILDTSAKSVIYKSTFSYETLFSQKKYFDVNKTFIFHYFMFCKNYNNQTNKKQDFKESTSQ